MRLTVALLALALLSPSAIAATFVVEPDGTGDYPNIQSAIDAVDVGDVIELADGVFVGLGNANLDFGGKDLIIRSQSLDPAAVVLDLAFASNQVAFRFTSGETPGSVVSDITIRYGHADVEPGGAVYVTNGSGPVFENCVFEECFAEGAGGAVGITGNGVGRFRDCVFRNNIAAAVFGSGQGGAIYCENASLFLYDCVVEDNFAGGKFDGLGGGIFIQNGTSQIFTTVLKDNRGGRGGAVYLTGDTFLEIRDGSVVHDNDASESGGGVHVANGGVSFLFFASTMTQNTAVTGGGLFSRDAQVEMTQGIFWGNEASTAPEVLVDGGAFRYSCAVVDLAGIVTQSGGFTEESQPSVFIDPLFCDPDANLFTIAMNSPAAAANSPCGQLIGALDVGCGPTPTVNATWGTLKGRFR